MDIATDEKRGFPCPTPDEKQGYSCFSIPQVSERLLWRLVRLFRDITWLSRLPQNERGGAFAGNAWFSKKYKCDARTVARWMATLEAHGWIKRVLSGPNRVAVPIVCPRVIAQFCPRFVRLLRSVLSGFRPSPLYLSEREESSNKRKAEKAKKPIHENRGFSSEPAPSELSPAESAVVVQAANAGVSEEKAPTLVREVGAAAVLDALDTLRWRIGRGKQPENPGGFVVDFARKVAEGVWKLPAAIVEARAKRERAEERRRAREARIVQSPEKIRELPAVENGQPSVPDKSNPAFPSLSDLPEDEREVLLQTALTAALAEKLAPPIRASIERKGTTSPFVAARASELLRKSVQP